MTIGKHQEHRLPAGIIRRSTAKKRRRCGRSTSSEERVEPPTTVVAPIANAAVEAAIPLLRELLGTWRFENELVGITRLDPAIVRDELAKLRNNGEITVAGSFGYDSTMYTLRNR